MEIIKDGLLDREILWRFGCTAGAGGTRYPNLNENNALTEAVEHIRDIVQDTRVPHAMLAFNKTIHNLLVDHDLEEVKDERPVIGHEHLTLPLGLLYSAKVGYIEASKEERDEWIEGILVISRALNEEVKRVDDLEITTAAFFLVIDMIAEEVAEEIGPLETIMTMMQSDWTRMGPPS